MFVRSLFPPRSFDKSSPNLVGVCRLTSHLPLRGSFSKTSTGRRVNGSLSLSTILYMRQPHATHCKGPLLLCCCLLQSLIWRLLLNCISMVYVGRHRWTSQLPFRGSFSKRSTGRRVNASNGSTGHISTVYVRGPHNCP